MVQYTYCRIVNGDIYMDFKAATDSLFIRVTAEDMAKEAGISLQGVRQARISGSGRRSPPPGWEKAAARLAQKQAAHFTKLAERLSRASQER
jgi:hypothetical protein